VSPSPRGEKKFRKKGEKEKIWQIFYSKMLNFIIINKNFMGRLRRQTHNLLKIGFLSSVEPKIVIFR
jgi:hypothetical protein